MSFDSYGPNPDLYFTDELPLHDALRRKRRRGVREWLTLLGLMLAGLGVLWFFIYLYVRWEIGDVPQDFAGLGRRIEIQPGNGRAQYELFYTRDVTGAEAQKLASYLRETGLLGGEDGASVQLAKEGETYVVSFVVQNFVWEKQPVIEFYSELRREMSDKVFDSEPVIVRLCESQLLGKAGGPPELVVRKVISD